MHVHVFDVYVGLDPLDLTVLLFDQSFVFVTNYGLPVLADRCLREYDGAHWNIVIN